MKTVLKISAVIGLGAVLLPLAAMAASTTDFSIQNPLQANNIEDLFKLVSKLILDVAIPVAVVMILWAGFNFLTAAGNPTKIQKGKQILTWTAVGLAIIFIGGGFIDLLKSILNQGK